MEPERGPGGLGVADLSHLNALVLEETMTTQNVVGRMLELLGARLRLALTPKQALRALEEDRFDIALVAASLDDPAAPGADFVTDVRSRAAERGVAIKVLLLAASMEIPALLERTGADGAIVKPLPGIVTFGDTIRRALEGDASPAAAGAQDAVAETLPPLEKPVLDASVLDDLARSIGGDAMEGVLAAARAEFEGAEAALRAASAGPDLQTLREVTHVLMGISGQFGALALEREARALNRAIHAGFGGDGAARLAATISMLGEVRARLAGWRPAA